MKYVTTRETGIFDLCITYSSGAKVPLKLNKGEVLPVDLIDPKDLEKSLRLGGLGRLIKSGWIKEVDDKELDKTVSNIVSTTLPSEKEKEIVSPKTTTKPYSNIEMIDQNETETKREKGMTEIIKTHSSDGTSVPIEMIDFGQGIGTNNSGGLVPLVVEMSPTDPRTVKPESLDDYSSRTDFSVIHTYSSFAELNHPDQISYVKQCCNKTLLNEILTTNSKKQIQNNAKRRLEDLK